MAFIRLLFRLLLGLLILLALIGLLLPSATLVERSIVIDAAPQQVFAHLDSMRAFHAWSPWTDIDPSTSYDFSGPETGVGSRMQWSSGDQRVGRGSQEITLSEPYRRVETTLTFGDQGEGQAAFLLEPVDGQTRLRWQFRTAFGWDLFARYVGLMLDSMIGAAYDRGLRELKARIEAPPPTNG